MTSTRALRIYIAGPMTGVEQHNFPAFNRAAEELRAAGWDVVNPADHGIIEGFEWADYLRYDLTKLASCTDLYLLPGWEHSKGATLETIIARTLGFNFHYASGAKVLLGHEALRYTAITDADITEITSAKLGPWPSFEAQSWACKVVKAICDAVPPKPTSSVLEAHRELLRGAQPDVDDYRLHYARYVDVCRVLDELLPGWDDTSRHGDSGLALKAIRRLAAPPSDYASMQSKAESWDAVVAVLGECDADWTQRGNSNCEAAVKTIRRMAVLAASDPTGAPAGRPREVAVTSTGVAFGNAWLSHEKITGFTAEQLNSGKCGVIGNQYMAWLEEALRERGEPVPPPVMLVDDEKGAFVSWSVINFLHGLVSLNGKWFGDEKGYKWRKFLPFKAIPPGEYPKPCTADAVTGPESMMLLEIHAELKRARGLFPGDRITTLAMAEEFGELVKAVLDEPAANVRKEAVQTAVMAMRVVLDGDGSVNDWRAAKGLDKLGGGE